MIHFNTDFIQFSINFNLSNMDMFIASCFFFWRVYITIHESCAIEVCEVACEFSLDCGTSHLDNSWATCDDQEASGAKKNG